MQRYWTPVFQHVDATGCRQAMKMMQAATALLRQAKHSTPRHGAGEEACHFTKASARFNRANAGNPPSCTFLLMLVEASSLYASSSAWQAALSGSAVEGSSSAVRACDSALGWPVSYCW